jgi:hypothetical protein
VGVGGDWSARLGGGPPSTSPLGRTWTPSPTVPSYSCLFSAHCQERHTRSSARHRLSSTLVLSSFASGLNMTARLILRLRKVAPALPQTSSQTFQHLGILMCSIASYRIQSD